MSKFSEALKSLRVKNDYTQKQLADLLGVSESTIGMYERGQREPKFEALEEIADVFNVYMSDLIETKSTETDVYSINNILPLPKTYKLPLLGEIACGQPILAAENALDEIDAPEGVDADFCLRCKGDSMVNARIFDGDIVFVRKQSMVSPGEIAVVLWEGEATLKRFKRYGNTIVLGAENPAYEDIVIEMDESTQVRVLGKAVAFISTVK